MYVLLREVPAAVGSGVKKLLTEADYLKIRRKRRHTERLRQESDFYNSTKSDSDNIIYDKN